MVMFPVSTCPIKHNTNNLVCTLSGNMVLCSRNVNINLIFIVCFQFKISLLDLNRLKSVSLFFALAKFDFVLSCFVFWVFNIIINLVLVSRLCNIRTCTYLDSGRIHTVGYKSLVTGHKCCW